MATLNSKTSGNFTSSATWGLVDSASLLDSETSSGSAGTSWTGTVAGTTFAPGAITVEGVGVKLLNKILTATGTFAVRVVPQGSISSVTIGNPATITTSVAHGLSTGDTVTIAGTTTSASVNNTFSVTVTGATTFTVPVNVTSVTVGTGTWTRALAVISSNSVAAATVITTSGTHGLTTGTSITISGVVGSVPSINGTWTVTALSTNTFSIPVNVSVGGTGGVFHINSGSPNTTVSVSTADLPTPGTGNAGSCSGWFFFKFPSNATFTAGTGYSVQIYCFTNAGVTAYTNGTTGNWSRFFRLTTTQAPAAGDVLYVAGEYTAPAVSATNTVTMDNTSADVFGKVEVSGKGVLAYGTAASTNYQLICNGDFRVNGAGTASLGSTSTRIPSTSTALLQLNQGGVNVTNGILLRGTGIFRTGGNNKTWQTTLSANASAGATSISSTDVTGWSSGEDILIASTTRTAGETELRTLAVDSVGNTITVPALSFAHSGTAGTQAELANLTRNVKIRGQSTSLQTYINVQSDSTFDFNDSELQYMGSATANKRGMDVLVITGGLGSFLLRDCAIKNFEVTSSIAVLFNQATNTNCTVDGCIFYRINNSSVQTGATTTTGITITDTWAFSGIVSSSLFNLSMQGGTFTGCRAISSAAAGISISNVNNVGLTISDLVAHSNATAGITLTTISESENYHLLTGVTTWRNTTRGVLFTGAIRTQLDTLTSFGNGTDGLEFSASILVDVSNATIDGGTTLVQPFGILFASANTGITINNSPVGVSTAHTTAAMSVNTTRQYHDVALRNCTLTDSTEISTQTNLSPGGSIGSSRNDQTNNVHKMWKKYGTISADSTFTVYPPLSSRYTPTNASYKLISQVRQIAVPAGKSVKVGVYVRRSVAGDGTAYNGNLPRLILKENSAAGVASDTVLATAGVASLGAFEFISATTVAATTDSVFTFVVDCDGTAGWVNSDHWRVEIINGGGLSTNVNPETYWVDGYSAQGINTTFITNSGTDTYWSDGAPAADLFPLSNSQTGRFFPLFQ